MKAIFYPKQTHENFMHNVAPKLNKEVKALLKDAKTPFVFNGLTSQVDLSKGCYTFAYEHMLPYSVHNDLKVTNNSFLKNSSEMFEQGLHTSPALTQEQRSLVMSKIFNVVQLYKFYPADLLKELSKRSGILHKYADLWRYNSLRHDHKADRDKPFLTLFSNCYRRLMRVSKLWRYKKLDKTKIFHSICDVINGVEYMLGALPRKFVNRESFYDTKVLSFWNRNAQLRLEQWKKVLKQEVVIPECVKKVYQVITQDDLQHAWSRQREIRSAQFKYAESIRQRNPSRVY
jgi:hypothetical protein